MDREPSTVDLLRLLAAWALVHEGADEAWKAAVARGAAAAPGAAADRPDAFVDVLAALVAEEKERLKAALTGAAPGAAMPAGVASSRTLGSTGDRGVAAALEAVRFEVAELRGRLESLQASVDALGARRGD